MDLGPSSSIIGKRKGRNPLQKMRYNRKASQENLDRFIPNRSAMDFDFAHYMLTEGRKIDQSPKKEGFCPSPYGEGYKKLIAETLGMDRTRILAFKSKPPEPVELFPRGFSADTDQSQQPKKPHRNIRQTADRVLDAPGMQDDFYSNLLDWGSNNIISVALENSVYLWDASTSAIKELVVTDDENGPVTSVKWSPDQKHLAVGLTNSDIQLWDATSAMLLRTLTGVHQSGVGSLEWNKHILTTGGLDGNITNNDVRVRSHILDTYRGHSQEICALKWSSSGQQLASGGNDNLLHVWDRSMANSERWLHRFQDHTAAVKGLAWCPFQANLLASGGGAEDGSIKFWNSHTGACLNSVQTGSLVCALLWSTNERELLSAHGFTRNQLTLWKYPSMVRIAELNGHTSEVLYMAQSPNGCTVATASGDESLRLWNVFGDPEMVAAKPPGPKTTRPTEPFANFNQIR